MFTMNEDFFAELQKECCWFTFFAFEPLPEISPRENLLEDPEWNDDVCAMRHIFAMTFGGFGYSVDLEKAKLLATIKLGQLEKRAPMDKSPNNPEFIRWLELFAQSNILLGTIFAYLHKYSLAAFLLMKGLKTRAVNLFLPYCDFINYVLSKVDELPAENACCEGCGFSVDEPMGSTELNNGRLNVRAAEMIISALEGDNGEIVLFYSRYQRYGNLKRLGSTESERFKNRIDIYEVLTVDRKFNLKKLRFYFNGYFTLQNGYSIRLPKGFHLDPLSEAAQIFKVVDDKF